MRHGNLLSSLLLLAITSAATAEEATPDHLGEQGYEAVFTCGMVASAHGTATQWGQGVYSCFNSVHIDVDVQSGSSDDYKSSQLMNIMLRKSMLTAKELRIPLQHHFLIKITNSSKDDTPDVAGSWNWVLGLKVLTQGTDTILYEKEAAPGQNIAVSN